MKVKISFLRIFVLWLIVFLILAGAILLLFRNLFFSSWNALQIFIVTFYLLVMVFFLILSNKFYYYEINKKYFIVSSFKKKYQYNYNEIAYLDQKKGRQTGHITFVTSRGDTINLTSDKNHILYDTLLKECKNLLSYSEIKHKFPRANI